jgi:uncharacterized protein with von Willebrand factor type A (vWA) domain
MRGRAVKDLPLFLAHLGGELRREGVGTTLKDELDAAEAAMLVDFDDREELRRALRIALKIPRAAFETFDRLFGELVAAHGGPPAKAPPAPRTLEDRPRRATASRARFLRWDPDARRLVDGDPTPEPEGDEPGYSPSAMLRSKRFDELDQHDRVEMERLIARLARRLATRKSRRLVPTRGRGSPDLRASFRRSLRTFGEMVQLSRRARPRQKPRLVFLCDTSGSMDVYTRFLLVFVLSLRRVLPSAEVFVFNTELVRLTPALSRGEAQRVLDRIADTVPDWSGGTRLGESLAAFAKHHLARCVDGKTVVVILSDGLDQGDPATLAGAASAIRARAKKVLWLNPLLGDPRYEPTARGMSAALPFVDKLCPAHDIASLERLLPHLTG